MDVSISQFRRDLFHLVDVAMSGEQVYVRHRGSRFRIVPEVESGDRLSRVKPLQVTNPAFSKLGDTAMKKEMSKAWERDWADL